MFRIAMAVILVAAIMGVGVSLSAPPAAAQQASATRSFDKTTVEPGKNVAVTITIGDYGGFGAVTEMLPDGFSYVSSDLDTEQVTEVDARTVRFTLRGDASFTYTVTASSAEGSHDFSGELRDSDLKDHDVGGATMVTVEAAAPPPDEGPSASRSFDKPTVEPGKNVTVTITIDGDYGGVGAVTEMLPDGFSYVSSDLDTEQVTEVDARTVRFTLRGDASFTYTVTASSAEGSHDFSGELRDSDLKDHDVGGATMVTVEAAAPPPDEGPSASRSFDKPTVEPGKNVTVTITIDGDYGGVGAVTEMLPDGFSYVSSDLDTEQVTEVDARTVRFTLRGDASFTYTVTASSAEGSHDFSGELRDSDLKDHDVGGATMVTVEAAAPRPPRPPRPPVQVPNRAPVFSGNAVTRSVNENSASGANVGAPVVATDSGILTYMLGGADAGYFGIVAATGQIQVGDGTNLDYEGEKNTYVVEVTATDPSGASDMITVTVNVTNVEEMGEGAEAGDPLFGYDTSGNGRIDKDELAKAVFDYEIDRTLEKPALADLVFSYELGL